MFDNEIDRFGSASWATEHDIAAAGLFHQGSTDPYGLQFRKRPMYLKGMAGDLVCAGARGGKLTTFLSYNILPGICNASQLILDMKGELAAISLDQTLDRKFCIYWNPVGLHGIAAHRINPVDYAHIDSASLVADVKVLCQNLAKLSGSANASFFEERAREFLEGVILTLVRLNGVLTFPDLYDAVNLIPGGGDDWLDFAFEMNQSEFTIASRTEEEIAASRSDPGGGFKGIVGELLKSLAALSDPVLRESVSPPFDFSLKQLCDSDQRYNFYLMCPAQYIEAWAPIIKASFVAGMIYKSRAPHAPQQVWILDECSQLGSFPLAVQLMTYGAGIGIRPVIVVQSSRQLRALGPNAEEIVTSSAGTRIYFTIRDLTSASEISRMLGVQTLLYDDELRQGQANHSSQQAIRRLMEGDDAFAAAMDYAHYSREAVMPSKQQRLLLTPDEVLNLPSNKAIVFTDGVDRPILADRVPYYEQRFMAGRFHPTPYHPPADRVRVKTLLGHRWRKVIREPVPAEFAHYPQYADGFWSRIGQ